MPPTRGPRAGATRPDRPRRDLPVQRSLDDLGTPLVDVIFCVLDIETTGTDRGDDAITEIGMVKVCGGEQLGTLGTLVNPGRAIPPQITLLTGITESMVMTAPRFDDIIPTLLEFIGDAVVVGHNVGFDLGFINTALRRSGRPALDNRVVDTLALARRLVRDEVPDCKLGTLARHLRLPHRPTHRALDDALTTTQLLHALLERAATLGVMGLDDLVELPSLAAHPQAAKLPLTDRLPRSPGVYRFLGADDEVLYVGKATNLRQRVRSYFGSDDRRKVGALLRETRRIEHTVTPDPVVAEVLELRYLHLLRPRYNRVGTTWHKYCYVRLDTDARWPRLSIVTAPAATGLHLGPLPSRAAATAIIEAVQTVVPIRRCAVRATARRNATPCHAASMGLAICPCVSGADESAHWHAVSRVVAAFTLDPNLVLAPLWSRVERLAAEQRYEEAALTRDRARAFAAAIERQRTIDALRSAGELDVRIDDTVLHVRDGVLASAHLDGCLDTGLDLAPPVVAAHPTPLDAAAADEVWFLARTLDRLGDRVRVLSCTGTYATTTAPVRVVTRLADCSPPTELQVGALDDVSPEPAAATAPADDHDRSITAPAWSMRSTFA